MFMFPTDLEPADSIDLNRHLHQERMTADGNHQSCQYEKNTDPDDVSLSSGNAYFPNDEVYKAYLKIVPKKEDVSNSPHILMDSATDWVLILEIDLQLSKRGQQARPQEVQKHERHWDRQYTM